MASNDELKKIVFAAALAATILIALAACAPAPTPQAPTPLPPTPAPQLTIVIPPTERLAQATTTSTRVPAIATPTPPRFDAAKLKTETDAMMTGFMHDQSLAGCSVAMVYPDATDKLQKQLLNYGTLSRESKTPVDSSTFYEIGSLTKLFTADLLALFVKDGMMKLDDPLQKYLPSNVHVPTFNNQAITLRELATHTSSLPRNVGQGLGLRQVSGVLVEGYQSEDDLFNFLNAYQLTRAPDSKWDYSNLAFALLGIADEKAGNASYENLVTKKIAELLGMHETRITLSAADKSHLAQGYSAQGNKAAPFTESGGNLGAGAIRATIQDLATYLAANIAPNETQLSSVLQATHQSYAPGPSPQVVPGLGWNIMNPGTAQEEFIKDGSTGGFNSYISFSQKSRTGFVIVCNGHNVEKVAPGLLKLFGKAEAVFNENQ